MNNRRSVIPNWDGPDTRVEIIDAVAYLDTVVLHCWKMLPPTIFNRLSQDYGKRLSVKEITVPKRTPRTSKCWRITIHQPKSRTLLELAKLQAQARTFVVARVDIAIDFIAESERAACLIHRYLQRHTLQKWHGSRRTQVHVDTAYWSKKASPRNVALYSDKPSKTDNMRPCAHLELRFCSADACRRRGLHDLKKLAAQFDVAGLLDHEVQLRSINAKSFNRHCEAYARKAKRAHYPDLTVREVRSRHERVLWPTLQHYDFMPDAQTITGVYSQDLYDRLPKEFRACLKQRIAWNDLAPTPRWVNWCD